MENSLSAVEQPEAVFASHASVKNGIISLCPTLDLLAIADQSDSVNVFRFNGQFAFGKKRPTPEAVVQSICWRYDGMLTLSLFFSLFTRGSSLEYRGNPTFIDIRQGNVLL